ncbi:hypothetical protein SDAV_00622 [Spiroplasma phoeniceum P40]|uniref:Uncharacterized protein n=1 Tax=Spiroplasma phoeniceum P40 TaxID=1276259 RepID=A0A345DN25_9MOLU|nr:hypothetical protein SDAV_00622 [Spiroplasma phoeniceum P40]
MSKTVKIILGSIGGTFFLGLFTFLGIVVRERNKTKRRKFELKHQTFLELLKNHPLFEFQLLINQVISLPHNFITNNPFNGSKNSFFREKK